MQQQATAGTMRSCNCSSKPVSGFQSGDTRTKVSKSWTSSKLSLILSIVHFHISHPRSSSPCFERCPQGGTRHFSIAALVALYLTTDRTQVDLAWLFLGACRCRAALAQGL